MNVAVTLRPRRSSWQALLRGNVAILGAGLVVAGSALPWGGSGRVDRSGFALAALAGRLDLLDGPVAGLARAWVLAPLVLAVVAVAAATRRPGIALGAAGALAAAGTALATAVLRSPLAPRPGLLVTVAGAAVVASTPFFGTRRAPGARNLPKNGGWGT